MQNTKVPAKPQDPAALAQAPRTVEPEDLHASNTQAFAQQASNKLDKASGLGYHRTNGKVQQRSRFVGPSHITNRRHAHLVRSSMRAARSTLESKPIKDLMKAGRLQGIGNNSSNQQASKDSSTVDQRARSTDKQAKPSSNRQASMDPGTSFKHP